MTSIKVPLETRLMWEAMYARKSDGWTPASGSVVEAIACFCGKCWAFMPKTYVSHSRITLIGDTVLSECCGHKLEFNIHVL